MSVLCSTLLFAVEPTAGSALWRLVTLQDYNTWVPLLATALVGLSAGVIGTFLVLRGRALVGDVVGHAALPGIVLTFLASEMIWGGGGRSIPLLLTGAMATGLAGAVCVLVIDRYSKAKSDAALAIVLSLFYGSGAVLLSIAQRLDSGSQAGLKNYLSGKTASLVASDVWLSAVLAGLLLGVTLLLFKEWTLLCFDDAYGATQGYPAGRLDALLIGLAAVISVLGMQSVGLVLVVGLLIIPPASARFWTDDIRWMAAGSGLIGGLSGGLGVALSSLAPKIATGPTVILLSGLVFAVSLCLGRRRGFIWGWLEQVRLRREIQLQDLLRSAFRIAEGKSGRTPSAAELIAIDVPVDELQRAERGNRSRFESTLRRAEREELVTRSTESEVRLTCTGADTAARLIRNHRLWELYLVEYADIAPAVAHRYAETIEHVLDPEVISRLYTLLVDRQQDRSVNAASSAPAASEHPGC